MKTTHLASRLAVVGMIASTVLFTTPAAAEEGFVSDGGALPVAVSLRPMTLPQGTLRIDAGFAVSHASLGLFEATALGFNVGGGYGITSDIEVGATLPRLIFQIDPTGDVLSSDPEIYGRFRFLSGDFELGAIAALRFPTESDFFGILAGIDGLAHIGNARIDFGLRFQADVYTGSSTSSVDPRFSLDLPVSFTINPTDSFYFGIATGLKVVDLDQAGDTILVPLGLNVGYTIASDARPVVDLNLGFSFPNFLTTAPGVSNPVTEVWVIGFNADIFLDFGG